MCELEMVGTKQYLGRRMQLSISNIDGLLTAARTTWPQCAPVAGRYVEESRPILPGTYLSPQRSKETCWPNNTRSSRFPTRANGGPHCRRVGH